MAVLVVMAAMVAGGAWAATVTSITPNNSPLAGASGSSIAIRATPGDDFTAALTSIDTVIFQSTSDPTKLVTWTGAQITVAATKVTIKALPLPGVGIQPAPLDANGAGIAGPYNVVLQHGGPVAIGGAADIVTVANGFSYTNNQLQVNAVAQINSVLDISWDNGLQPDSKKLAPNTHPLGDVGLFTWDVGGIPAGGLVPVSTASTYILSLDFTVKVRNLGSQNAVMYGQVDVGTGALGGSATTPTLPATAGWTLAPAPAGDTYALSLSLAGGSLDLSSAVATFQPIGGPGGSIINPGVSQQLDMTYQTPATVTTATSNGPQTSVVTLQAQAN